mmetsp:Transcript_33325/g.74582  ORF Transcript_33325/g.74582 Transcript_33325/m.74582 type:complete len:209 (-) Transcript_33325:297-923(-)
MTSKVVLSILSWSVRSDVYRSRKTSCSVSSAWRSCSAYLTSAMAPSKHVFNLACSDSQLEWSTTSTGLASAAASSSRTLRSTSGHFSCSFSASVSVATSPRSDDTVAWASATSTFNRSTSSLRLSRCLFRCERLARVSLGDGSSAAAGAASSGPAFMIAVTAETKRLAPDVLAGVPVVNTPPRDPTCPLVPGRSSSGVLDSGPVSTLI